MTEDHIKMQDLERKYFPYQTECQDDYYSSASIFSSASTSPILSACSFGGLFIIMGLTLFFPCFIYLINLPPSNAINSKSSVIWCTIIRMLLKHNSASVVNNVVENLHTHQDPTRSFNQATVEMVITGTDNGRDPNQTETDDVVDSDHELYTYGCS